MVRTTYQARVEEISGSNSNDLAGRLKAPWPRPIDNGQFVFNQPIVENDKEIGKRYTHGVSTIDVYFDGRAETFEIEGTPLGQRTAVGFFDRKFGIKLTPVSGANNGN